MGWYSAPNVLPQALQAELMELSKSGDAQMNAILETIGDLEGYEEADAIELIESICDEFVVTARHLKKEVLKHKPKPQDAAVVDDIERMAVTIDSVVADIEKQAAERAAKAADVRD